MKRNSQHHPTCSKLPSGCFFKSGKLGNPVDLGFSIGKPPTNSVFSIAIFVYQRAISHHDLCIISFVNLCWIMCWYTVIVCSKTSHQSPTRCAAQSPFDQRVRLPFGWSSLESKRNPWHGESGFNVWRLGSVQARASLYIHTILRVCVYNMYISMYVYIYICCVFY